MPLELLFIENVTILVLNFTNYAVQFLQRYGVWADWNNPYLTLSPEYEAAQVTIACILMFYFLCGSLKQFVANFNSTVLCLYFLYVRLRCLVKWPFKGIYLEGESQFTGVLHHELLLQRLNWR